MVRTTHVEFQSSAKL